MKRSKARTQERCAISRQWQTRFKAAALSQQSLLQASSMNEDTVDEITGLANTLGRLLGAMNAQVTTAESCTGGGIAEAITRIAGSSAWFEAGYVTYSNAQKTRQLGVPEALFADVGAVSQPVVEAMVRGAQRESGARFAVAVSGVAGPGGGSPDKPVGTVWLCWGKDDALVAQRRQFDGDRDQVRRQTVEAALQGLIQLARGEMPKQG
ncbi:Competence/damage-inducible protein CinA domain protein [Pseudomonas viridiflava]|nr:Competence/damage-inducible protein CinA domain protein [Pseudomonas viridiflava]